MPKRNAEESLESPAPVLDGASTKRRRIPRACDRCRLKKSKCDGARQCRTCQLSNSPCIYRTRRNRESKNYYWHMRDIFEKGLQELYRACRQGSGFPDTTPIETDGSVTTHAILEGLGLIGSAVDNIGLHEFLMAAREEPQAKAICKPTPPLTAHLSRHNSSTSVESAIRATATSSISTTQSTTLPRVQNPIFPKNNDNPTTLSSKTLTSTTTSDLPSNTANILTTESACTPDFSAIDFPIDLNSVYWPTGSGSTPLSSTDWMITPFSQNLFSNNSSRLNNETTKSEALQPKLDFWEADSPTMSASVQLVDPWPEFPNLKMPEKVVEGVR